MSEWKRRLWAAAVVLFGAGGLATTGCGRDDGSEGDRARKERKRRDDDDGGTKKNASKAAAERDEGGEAKVGEDGLLRASDGSIPPLEPDRWRLPPMGSWAQTGPAKDSKGSPPTTKVSWLEKRKDDEYRVQVEVSGAQSVLAKAWVRIPDLRTFDKSGIKLLSLEGKVGPLGYQKFPVGSNPLFEQLFDRFLALVTPLKLDALPREDVETPLGLFRQCYVREDTLSVMGITVTTKSYLHPAVGGSSAVKTVTDKGEVTVLIALDDDGAKEVTP